MFSLFRQLGRISGETPLRAAVSMVGAKPGDSVLLCGSSRPDIAGEVGRITGLNGQTTVVDRRDGAAERIRTAAAAAGTLVDFEDAPLTMLPFDDGAWDVAVVVDGLAAPEGSAGPILAEAVRVIRSGGRLVLFDRVSRPGLFGLWRSPAESVQPADTITATLAATGLRGVRLLADVDGVRYFEGTKITRG